MPSAKRAPVARVEQLIRSSPQSVFNAFVQPALLKKFWLSKASAPLELGKMIHWEFMVPGAEDDEVLALDESARIRVQWSDGTITEWTFTEIGRNQTLVHIEQSGFTGSADTIFSTVMETTQGFAYVLSDLKVLLEKDLRSGIVKDKAKTIARAMQQA